MNYKIIMDEDLLREKVDEEFCNELLVKIRKFK